jgi:hypothetical protein
MEVQTTQQDVPVFENTYGKIPAGTEVTFMVENQDQWGGDLTGTLIYQEGEYRIRTERSGTLTINKRYDVYHNTIRPLNRN